MRARLRTTAELAELRARSGGVPLDEFADQHELMLAVAPEGAVLAGEALVRIRDFVIAARTAEAFLRSRVEALPHLGAIVRDLVAPKELARWREMLLSGFRFRGGGVKNRLRRDST